MQEVDPQAQERLDPAVEDVLLEIADEFIDTVTRFSCELALHRKSKVLEARDLQLHLERCWHMSIPGIGNDESRNVRRKLMPGEGYRMRREAVKAAVAKQQALEAEQQGDGGDAALTTTGAPSAPG